MVRQRGATLLEVVMAAGLLGLIGYGVMVGVSDLFGVAKHAELRNDMENLRSVVRTQLSCVDTLASAPDPCPRGVFLDGKDRNGRTFVKADQSTRFGNIGLRVRCHERSSIMVDAAIFRGSGDVLIDPMNAGYSWNWKNLFHGIPIACPQTCPIINTYFTGWIDGNSSFEVLPDKLIVHHSREYPPGGFQVLAVDSCGNERLSYVYDKLVDHGSLRHASVSREIPFNFQKFLLTSASARWARRARTTNLNLHPWVSPRVRRGRRNPYDGTWNRRKTGLSYVPGRVLKFGALDSPPSGAAYYAVSVCRSGFRCPY